MAKMAMDLEAMKAAFAARGGVVTKVESGVRAIENDKLIYKAMREGGRVAADVVRLAQESEARFHRQQDAYCAAKHSGWSDAAAHDYAEHAK